MSEVKFDADGGLIIKTIQDSVKTEVIDAKVGDFTTRQIYRVDEEPLAAALGISSLTGLVDYLNDGIDLETRDGIFVQVLGPTEVKVKNVIKTIDGRRFTPIVAQADTPDLRFDNYLRLEEAIIMLQSRFVETEDRVELVSSLGNIVADEELQQEDDGFGQKVTIQKGIQRSGMTIKNPVMLKPFRTFTEVDQPVSPFIIRLRKNDSDGILVAIFEADGGAWRNAARLSVKEFIEKNLTAKKGDKSSVAIPVIA